MLKHETKAAIFYDEQNAETDQWGDKKYMLTFEQKVHSNDKR